MAGQVWRFCSFCYSIFTSSSSFPLLCVLFLSLAFTLAVVVIVVVDCLLVSFGCLILSFRWLRAFVLSFILSFDFFPFFSLLFACRIFVERIVLLSHAHSSLLFSPNLTRHITYALPYQPIFILFFHLIELTWCCRCRCYVVVVCLFIFNIPKDKHLRCSTETPISRLRTYMRVYMSGYRAYMCRLADVCESTVSNWTA